MVPYRVSVFQNSEVFQTTPFTYFLLNPVNDNPISQLVT